MCHSFLYKNIRNPVLEKIDKFEKNNWLNNQLSFTALLNNMVHMVLLVHGHDVDGTVLSLSWIVQYNNV